MKVTTLAFTASTLFSLSTYAFPRLTPEQMKRALDYSKRDMSNGYPSPKAANTKRDAAFNPEAQLIGKFRKEEGLRIY